MQVNNDQDIYKENIIHLGSGEDELDRGGHKKDTRVAWIELREPVVWLTVGSREKEADGVFLKRPSRGIH